MNQGSPESIARAKRICGSFGSAEPLYSRRRPCRHRCLELIDVELLGVVEDGMSGRNGQRKPGTARGSPRRSRTAKASRISRRAVKSRCACERGGWGRLSDDGPGHYNPDPSEGPWGWWRTHLMAVHHRVHGLTLSGTTGVTTRCTKGGCKPDVGQRMPGAGLSWLGLGKAPPDKPAFQPYWGKPAVRNDRGIEETSASFEARSAPRSYPTEPH